MLSSFLPGQEAGNVPFVTGNGFGQYSKDPKKIGKTVGAWIQEPQKLEEMSNAARACAAPEATYDIAKDLLKTLDAAPAAAPPPIAQQGVSSPLHAPATPDGPIRSKGTAATEEAHQTWSWQCARRDGRRDGHVGPKGRADAVVALRIPWTLDARRLPLAA